nr:MAG TPA: hypothetical protein [Caudoviricetes sp.]
MFEIILDYIYLIMYNRDIRKSNRHEKGNGKK